MRVTDFSMTLRMSTHFNVKTVLEIKLYFGTIYTNFRLRIFIQFMTNIVILSFILYFLKLSSGTAFWNKKFQTGHIHCNAVKPIIVSVTKLGT